MDRAEIDDHPSGGALAANIHGLLRQGRLGRQQRCKYGGTQ
jgi:hypothetical protein